MKTEHAPKLQFIAHITPTHTVVTVWDGNEPFSTHYHLKGTSQDSAISKTEAVFRAVNSFEALVVVAEKYLATWPAAGPEDELATLARAALELAKKGSNE